MKTSRAEVVPVVHIHQVLRYITSVSDIIRTSEVYQYFHSYISITECKSTESEDSSVLLQLPLSLRFPEYQSSTASERTLPYVLEMPVAYAITRGKQNYTRYDSHCVEILIRRIFMLDGQQISEV